MKRMMILALCAVMTFGAAMTPAMAAAQPALMQNDAALEGGPRGGSRGGNRGRPGYRPSPNRGRYDRRRNDGYRRHRSGSGWVGLGIGAVVGTAIGAAIANSAPAPQQVMVFDPSCNCYYYR